MGAGGASAPAGTASDFATLQNLIKPFIGAGILALPSAFKNGGVLASAILMVILAVGVNYCIRCLLHSVDYVYARENGLDYDESSGEFSVAQAEEDPATGRKGHKSINDERGRAGLGAAHTKDGHVALSQEEEDADDLASPSGPHMRSASPSLGARVGSPSSVPLAVSPKFGAASNGNGNGAASASPRSPQVSVSSVVPAVGTPATFNGVGEKYMAAAHAPAQLPASSSGDLTSTHADPNAAPPVYTFREIGGFAFGRWGRLSVDINLVASQLGFCIAYMSFISQNLTMLTPGVSRELWLLILFLSWSLLVQVRSIERIAFTSMIGNLVYAVSLIIIFYDGFSNSCCVSAADTTWLRPEGLALVFGTGCFALEGIGLVLPVKRGMKNHRKFGSVLNIAIGIVASLYVLFGVLGYLFYGEHVSSVITKNLSKGILSDSVRVSLSLSLYTSFIIQMFPVTEITDGLWDVNVFYKIKSSDTSSTSEGGAPRVGAHRGGEGDRYRPLGEENEEQEQTGVAVAQVTYDTFPKASKSANGHGHGHAASSLAEGGGQGAVHDGSTVASGVKGERSSPLGWPTSTASAVATGHTSVTRHGVNWKREAAFVLTRVLLVAFTAVVSLIFKNFGLIIDLIGSFSNSAIAFILPMIFYIRLVLTHPERSPQAWAAHTSDSWWRRHRALGLPLLIVVAGCFASAVGVITTVHKMVKGDDD